jgi:copper homeostasis protein
LSEGGLTPSHALIVLAVERAGLPVHVLIRPRGGGFRYSEMELEVMAADILHAQRLGAAGVVLGVLTRERTVDVATTKELVALARPLQVTFHRAFDEAASLPEALEAVIGMGCDRLLTSGGCSDVMAGAEILHALIEQAQGRIAVAVGGGLRLESAAEVALRTGAQHFHGSLRSTREDGGHAVTSEAVQRMILELRES